MSKKLEGKVAVITGGNSGIALATDTEIDTRPAARYSLEPELE